MNGDLCSTPFGSFELQRVPVDRTGTLRAWDGADLLLLDAAASLGLNSTSRVLVVGDRFGALSIALSGFSPFVLSDSIVAEHATAANATRNHTPLPRFVSSAVSADELVDALGGVVDAVVWNVGKSMSMVLHVASLLSAVSHEGTVVLAAGMDKHLPPRTADALRRLGAVTTHPGRRKAHLFELRVHPGEHRLAEGPGLEAAQVHIAEHDLRVSSLPGVFSADQFDLGTRLLADLVADLGDMMPDARRIVDLGCGNGILGMLALRSLPTSDVLFIDESAHAIASARRNVRGNASTLGPHSEERAVFIRSDVFRDVDVSGVDPADVDLILCNPPFHHANATNDEVAWQMFQQSRRVLAPGGELWVVANRHLGYHEKLARTFSATAVMRSHPKFVVIAARR